MLKLLSISILAIAAGLPVAAQFQTRLNPETDSAFETYRQSAEAAWDGRPQFPSGLQAGQVKIAPANGKGAINVQDGLVHDWIAATIAPGATVDKTLAVLQNYAAYKYLYRPDIADSKLLGRDGNVWHAYLRMVRTNAITVVLNGEFDVQYRPLGNSRWQVVSRSTRIAEMDGDRELPAGTGHGFLWKLNAYWLIEPRPEGIYLECRAISLSRDVPFLLRPIVTPFVTSVPRESLQRTMEATVRALR